MRRAIRRTSIVGITLLSCAAACQVVAGIDRVDKVHSPPDAQLPPDRCAHVSPPLPPEKEDDSTFELAPFVLAARTFGVGDGPVAGFDLDGTCTCGPDDASARASGPSCVATKQAADGTPSADAGVSCDLEGDVDNASAARLLGTFFTGAGTDDELGFNEDVAKGELTILFYLQGYNGQANDLNVSLGIMVARGIHDPSGCPTGVLPDAGALDGGTLDAGDADGGVFYPPGWCGNDLWSVDRKFVSQDHAPFQPLVVQHAFVRDYQLVTQDPDAVVRIVIGGVDGEMSSPIFTGTLVPLGKDLQPVPADQRTGEPGPERRFRIDDGVLAGRLSTRTILSVAGSITVPGTAHLSKPQYFCANTLFPTLRSQLCDARDIASSKSLDFLPNRPCDAISFGFRATLQPAALAPDAVEKAPDRNPCSLENPATTPIYECADDAGADLVIDAAAGDGG